MNFFQGKNFRISTMTFLLKIDSQTDEKYKTWNHERRIYNRDDKYKVDGIDPRYTPAYIILYMKIKRHLYFNFLDINNKK